jgi:PhnB protein
MSKGAPERTSRCRRKEPAMSIRGGRPNDDRISPHLLVRDGEAAIAFYRQAFGAVDLYRSPMPGGAGLHAQLRIGGSTVMISTESLTHVPDLGVRAPQTLGAATAILELYVDDVDAVYRRAIAAGATATLPPHEQFGDRYGQLRDPFGHVWGLATVKEELTPEQIAEQVATFTEQMRRNQ